MAPAPRSGQARAAASLLPSAPANRPTSIRTAWWTSRTSAVSRRSGCGTGWSTAWRPSGSGWTWALWGRARAAGAGV